MRASVRRSRAGMGTRGWGSAGRRDPRNPPALGQRWPTNTNHYLIIPGTWANWSARAFAWNRIGRWIRIPVWMRDCLPCGSLGLGTEVPPDHTIGQILNPKNWTCVCWPRRPDRRRHYEDENVSGDDAGPGDHSEGPGSGGLGGPCKADSQRGTAVEGRRPTAGRVRLMRGLALACPWATAPGLTRPGRV